MEILKKCQELFDELKAYDREIKSLTLQLENKDLPYEKRVRLYEREFSLVIKISGAHDDLMKYLKELEKKEDMRFVANRMRKTAEHILKTEVIDVSSDV